MKFPWFIKQRHTPAKIAVLVYHRIAEEKADPWQLGVSPQNFEQHLQLFKKKFRVIDINELFDQLSTSSISENSVCLTFDDGYLDNFETAFPLLKTYSIPATFFVPSYYIIDQKMFWWDELAFIFFQCPELPEYFSDVIANEKLEFHLSLEKNLSPEIIKKQNNWKWPAKPPTKRTTLYLKIWELLKPLDNKEIESALRVIKNWAGFKDVLNADAMPMSMNQLQELSSHPLIKIGMHTHTHPAMGYHGKETQKREIIDNKIFLQQSCQEFFNAIAYPYGSYNTATLDAVKELGVDGAFSTNGFCVKNGSDNKALGRFQVNNWSAEQMEMKLLRWWKKA